MSPSPPKSPHQAPRTAEEADRPGEIALRLHARYRGKIQTLPRCPVRGLEDLAIWYTPGVAAPSRAIAANPDLVYEHTNKGNTVAVVSDGSRVLGLGNIGPHAAMPVMEGKALLFKYLGGVDAVPLCLHAQTPLDLVRAVRLLEPSFGGINLEDIAQPACFRILEELRRDSPIPVWHDDQQGTATVLLAALINALTLVGKQTRSVRIALIGMGAANAAAYRLLKAYGIDPAGIVACDSKGTLHRRRRDIERQRDVFREKWQVCEESNPDRVVGGVAEALRGADVAVAFSAPEPGLITADAVRGMARDAVVFACANPRPEIWPWDAQAAGAAIVATGRGDFPNQLNNSLCFPGMFRGVLDVRARSVSDAMALAVARELAEFAVERGLEPERLLPRMDEWEVHARVAAAAGEAAAAEDLADNPMSREALLQRARWMAASARRASDALARTRTFNDAAP